MGQIGRPSYRLGILVFSITLSIGALSSHGFTYDSNEILEDSIQKFTFGLVQLSSATHVVGNATGSIDTISATSPTNDNVITGNATVTAVNDLQAGQIWLNMTGSGGLASSFESTPAPITAGNFRTFPYSLDTISLADGDYNIDLLYVDSTIVQLDSIPMTIDRTAPTLPSVSIASNNAFNTTLATVGDTITLSITASEVLSSLSATIAGETAIIPLPNFTSWTAFITLNGDETDGPVTFAIDFADPAGNVGTQVSATTDASAVTIDETAPTTTIDSVNDGTSDLANNAFTNSTNANVTFTSDDNEPIGSGILSSFCQKKRSDNNDGVINDVQTDATCVSPKVYSSLLQGNHTIFINSTDNAGNIEATAIQSWIVDITAPTFTVPPDVRVGTASDVFANNTNVDIAIPTVTDNLDPSPTINNPQLTSYPLGNTTLTWTATDAAGNSLSQFQNVTVAKVNITSTSDSTPRWDVDELVISGKVFGFFAGDEIMVRWGDGSNTNVTSFTGGDGNTGADWTAEHNYTAAFSGQTLTVNATLVENPDIAISNNVLITVIPHLTSLIIDSLSDEDVTEPGINVRWDRDFNATVTVTDTEAGGDITGTVDGLEVQFKGNALNATSIFTDNVAGSATSASVITTLTANGTGSVGLQGLFANFTGTSAYVESGAFTLANITKHNTLTQVIFVENVDETDDSPSTVVSVPFDWFFNVTAKLTDLDSAANQGQTGDVGGKTINYTTSTAIGTTSATIFTTDGSNANFTTTTDTLTAAGAGNVGSGKTTVAVFSGDGNYKPSTGTNSTTITKQHTSLTLVSLSPIVINGSSINAVGILESLNKTTSFEPGFVAKGAEPTDTVEGKIITFTGNGTGTIVPSPATTEGVDISHLLGTNVDVVTCPTCVPSNISVLRLPINGTIEFPDGVKAVSFDVQNTGSNAVTFNVTRGDGVTYSEGPITMEDETVSGTFKTVTITGSNDFDGIKKITIANVTSSSFGPMISAQPVGITFMELTNSTTNQSLLMQINFTEATAPGSYVVPFALNEGSYSSLGKASTQILQNLNLKGTFAGDANFFGSESNDIFYDITEGTISGSAAGTGGTIPIAPDSGSGFSVFNCGAGNDDDNDGICNNWETAVAFGYVANGVALPYSLSDANSDAGDITEGITTSIIGDPNKKDIFVEIDYMTFHKPSVTAINDVIDAFTAKDINLHVLVDEELTHVTNLNVWRDLDADITNDFNSIKNRHFGLVKEHASVTDPTGFSSSPGGSFPDYNMFIIGSLFTSPSEMGLGGDFSQLEGKIVYNFLFTFENDPGDVTFGLGFHGGDETGANFDVHPAGAVMKGTFTRTGDSNTRILTLEPNYIANGALPGTSLSGAVGTVTLTYTTQNDPGTTSIALHGSPYITTSEKEARAQFVHYSLWGHNIGPGCGGASGLAETPGNDFIVGIGCNWGDDPTTDNGDHQSTEPDGTASEGSIQEQAGTFMHELGHNLGLLHGGPQKIQSTGLLASNANANCKPNYLSVMSYARQTNAYNGFLLDYSNGQFVGNPLDETNLSETTAYSANDAVSRLLVIGTPTAVSPVDSTQSSGSSIDWNNDDVFVASQAADINNFGINGCGASPNQTLIDHDDWANTVLNFRAEAGGSFDGTVPLDPFTKTIKTAQENSYDWYDGLYKYHTLHSNPGNEVVIGDNAYFLFQYLSCGARDIAGQPDTCIDPDKIVKQNLFYTEPSQNGEILTGADGEQELTVLTEKSIKATITQVSTGDVVATLGPFHEAVGLKGFYFFVWNTNDPAVAPPAPGLYEVRIFDEENNRTLSDLNFDPQFKAYTASGKDTTLILEVLGGGP